MSSQLTWFCLSVLARKLNSRKNVHHLPPLMKPIPQFLMKAQLDRLQNLRSPFGPDKRIIETDFSDQRIKHIFNGKDISGHHQKSHAKRIILKLQRCTLNNYSPQAQWILLNNRIVDYSTMFSEPGANICFSLIVYCFRIQSWIL